MNRHQINPNKKTIGSKGVWKPKLCFSIAYLLILLVQIRVKVRHRLEMFLILTSKWCCIMLALRRLLSSGWYSQSSGIVVWKLDTVFHRLLPFSSKDFLCNKSVLHLQIWYQTWIHLYLIIFLYIAYIKN